MHEDSEVPHSVWEDDSAWGLGDSEVVVYGGWCMVLHNDASPIAQIGYL